MRKRDFRDFFEPVNNSQHSNRALLERGVYLRVRKGRLAGSIKTKAFASIVALSLHPGQYWGAEWLD